LVGAAEALLEGLNRSGRIPKEQMKMLDLIFIALVLAFFGVAFWYVHFCERV
jgi:hypothetical protein